MSYRWFKEWADKTPKTIILIETREGFESFGTCATVVFRLTGAPLFTPNKKEKTKEPEVLVPMRDYPTLLDKMNRCRINYLVAREDFKVYSKEFEPHFFDTYTAPIKNYEKASEEDRMNRGLAVDDRVSVKNLETHKECCWTLVPEAEADVSRREKSGKLSIDSVMGNALLGHYVGEELTVVRGMNDSATYRILYALDSDNRKLKKTKREGRSSKAELAQEAAEEKELDSHLADIETFAANETDSNLDFLNPEPTAGAPGTPVSHLKTQNAHVSSALMSDDGPVLVLKEKTPEELAAEQAERDRIAAEKQAEAERAAEELAAAQAAEEQAAAEKEAAARAAMEQAAIEQAAEEQNWETDPPVVIENEDGTATPPDIAGIPMPSELEDAAAELAQPTELDETAAPTVAFDEANPFEADGFAEAAEVAEVADVADVPIEFIDPVAVINEMPVTVADDTAFADAAAAFADEVPVSVAEAEAFTASLETNAADAPAPTASIVPFATSLSELFFGPRKAGKARHAAAKRFKSDLPKSAKHVKTRAMRKLEKLAARSAHSKHSAAQ